MKNKLAQFYFFINNIDRRYIQFAYFTFTLAGFLFMQSPGDGGGTGR